MEAIRKYLVYGTAVLLSLLSLCACSSDDDSEGLEVIGKPMTFDISFAGDIGEGRTRAATALSTDRKVYISTDAGKTFYEYGYNTSSGLWEAEKKYNPVTEAWETTDGIIWTSSSMIIYALAFVDNRKMVNGSTTVEINADQTTEAALNQSDFYGVVTPVTYTTGKVSLTLQHQVGRLQVEVTNCKSPSTMTCQLATARYTVGTVTVGNERIEVTSQNTAGTIMFYRKATTSTTATFVANIFELGNLAGNVTIVDDGNTYNAAIQTRGGLAVDPGYITQINVRLLN